MVLNVYWSNLSCFKQFPALLGVFIVILSATSNSIRASDDMSVYGNFYYGDSIYESEDEIDFESAGKHVHHNSKEFDPSVMASEFLEDMDMNVRPCTNFQMFVCGKYARHNKFFHSRSRDFETERKQNLKALLIEPNLPDEIQPLKNVRNLYQACKSAKKSVNENDLHSLKDILSELGGWPMLEGNKWREDKFMFGDLMIKLAAIDANPFFSIDCGLDQANCAFRIGVSMFNHDGVSNKIDDPHVLAYSERLKTIITKLGGNPTNISSELLEIIDFDETMFELNRRFFTGGGFSNDKKSFSIDELMQKYPDIPYLDFYSAVVSPPIIVSKNLTVFHAKNSIPRLYKLIDNSSKRILANYALLHYIEHVFPFLNGNIFEKNPFIHNKALELPNCKYLIGEKLPLARDALYVRKYISKDARVKITDLISHIRAETKVAMTKIDFLDKETVKKVQEMVDKVNITLGYPEEFFDDAQLEKLYDGLVIPDQDLLQGLFNYDLYRLRSWNQSRSLDLFRNWLEYTNTRDVTICGQNPNQIRIPLEFLHGSVFHANQPNYLNFAGVGLYILTKLREIVSSVTKNTNNLETPMTGSFIMPAFYSRSHFTDSTERENNYKRMEMQIAYSAYKNWQSKNSAVEPQLPGMNYTANQMFWINVVHQTCDGYGSRSTGTFSSNLRNLQSLEEFREAFDCPNIPEKPPQANMNLDDGFYTTYN